MICIVQGINHVEIRIYIVIFNKVTASKAYYLLSFGGSSYSELIQIRQIYYVIICMQNLLLIKWSWFRLSFPTCQRSFSRNNPWRVGVRMHTSSQHPALRAWLVSMPLAQKQPKAVNCQLCQWVICHYRTFLLAFCFCKIPVISWIARLKYSIRTINSFFFFPISTAESPNEYNDCNKSCSSGVLSYPILMTAANANI